MAIDPTTTCTGAGGGVSALALHHYWSQEKGHKWSVVAAADLGELVHLKAPRYITFLATTVTDDPSSRVDAQYDGPFVIDIDRKTEQGGKAAAIQDVQNIARRFQALGVDLEQLQWFASGEKGFHVVVPTALFVEGRLSEHARRSLPAIYRELALSPQLYCDGTDLSLYSAGKGKMLRQANVQRENGWYKVPLTTAEILSMTPVLYDELVASPRHIGAPAALAICPALAELFEATTSAAAKQASKRPKPRFFTSDELYDLPDNVAVIEVVKREALRRIEKLLPEWIPGGEWQGDRYIVKNPMREDRRPGSFMVWADGGFRDWAIPEKCSGADLVALYDYLFEFGGQMEEAARKLAMELEINIDALLRGDVEAPAAAPAAKTPTRLLPKARGPEISGIHELLAKDFPPVRWVVQDVLPAGVTLFAAAPKTGKSWLALDVAICVAAGVPTLGGRRTHRGRVLYLALEDNERRLQGRITAVMAARGVTPDQFDYATAWERIDRGGTTYIDSWIADHPDAALVVVDTLAKVKPDLKANKDRYAQEYAAMAELKALSDRYGVALLVVTHTRKQAGEDPMDAISGSLGLSGGVDNAWVMKKARGEKQAALFVIGRDIVDEVNYGLQWDSDRCVWSIEGTAHEVMATAGRQDVLTTVRRAGIPMSVQDIAIAVGKDRSTVQRVVTALLDSKLVVRSKAGSTFKYAIA